ncbi:MAG: cupredoxin domain-containing protein [Methanoregulaceae archaeon]
MTLVTCMQFRSICLVLGILIALALAAGCTQTGTPSSAATPATVPATAAPAAPTTASAIATATPVIATGTVAGTPAWGTVVPTATPQTTQTTVYIRNFTFVPSTLTVLPGTQITWRNEDTTVHAVSATGNASGMFQSGDLIKGQEFSYTFGDVGTFDYICTYHPSMKGKIVVENGASIVGVPQYN